MIRTAALGFLFGLIAVTAHAQSLPPPSDRAQIAALQDQLTNAEAEITVIEARYIDARQQIAALEAQSKKSIAPK